MAVCAVAVLQPDGSYLLALNPAETNLSTCAYVVETGQNSVLGSLGSLTIENAETITASVVLLWAIAWGFRQIANLLQHSLERSDHE